MIITQRPQQSALALAVLLATTLLASAVSAETASNSATAAGTTTTISPAPVTAVPTDNKGDSKDPATAKATADRNAPLAVEAGTAVQNQAAVEALKAVQQASTAVAAKDIKAAQTALDLAVTHLKAIENTLPTAKIKQALANAQTNPDSADWTSIYQELDKLTVFLPAHSIKGTTAAKADTKADTKNDTKTDAKADATVSSTASSLSDSPFPQ